MATANFDQVVEQVKTLGHGEQLQLLALLEVWLTGAPRSPTADPMTEEEFEQEMLREGILDYIPPVDMDVKSFEEWEPVEVKGKPVSETIIEERR